MHAGLVIIVPGGITTETQLCLFGHALDAIEAGPDLINRVMEVYSDGSVQLRDWPGA